MILRVGNFEKTGHRVMLLDDVHVQHVFMRFVHHLMDVFSQMLLMVQKSCKPWNLGCIQPVGTGHGVNYPPGSSKGY